MRVAIYIAEFSIGVLLAYFYGWWSTIVLLVIIGVILAYRLLIQIDGINKYD